MERKQIVIGAVLVVVIIIAVIFTAKRSASGPTPPQWVMDQQYDKIDINTMEVVKASLGDWTNKYAADKSGHFKNPKTGQYTMVDAMKCMSCGEMIPVPQPPAELQAKGGAEPKGIMVDPAAQEKWRRECKCPKCGKSPFGQPGAPVQ